VSSQWPLIVGLRYEVRYQVVWVYTEAHTVLQAVVDFFFNGWCLEILSDNRILHVPGVFYSIALNFRLEAF
jgi:hypothetical protein